jgi:hypothetical protein
MRVHDQPHNRKWLTATASSACAAMALAVAGVQPLQALASRPASASRRAYLNETGRLHLTSKHGFTLNEQGTASGTAAGTIYAHLTLKSSSHVTAEVNIYPKGGSISGDGSGSYHRSGATAVFSGSMSISRGTGNYRHIRGSGLSFSGTIQESNKDAITVHVSGKVSD